VRDARGWPQLPPADDHDDDHDHHVLPARDRALLRPGGLWINRTVSIRNDLHGRVGRLYLRRAADRVR